MREQVRETWERGVLLFFFFWRFMMKGASPTCVWNLNDHHLVIRARVFVSVCRIIGFVYFRRVSERGWLVVGVGVVVVVGVNELGSSWNRYGGPRSSLSEGWRKRKCSTPKGLLTLLTFAWWEGKQRRGLTEEFDGCWPFWHLARGFGSFHKRL